MRRSIVVTASRGNPSTEYVEALREAGAEPVLVDAERGPDRVLDGAAGLLLTGGVDVDPAAYGAPSSPLVSGTEPERDALEIALLRDARSRALPTLCICRGLQIANVAFGGTLIADIPQTGTRIAHRLRTGNGPTVRGILDDHVVQIDEDSRLAAIVGTHRLVTGSRHHQAVERCAPELRIVASTEDEIVEALEARFPSPFWLAVQWHPESTRDADGGASRAIFRAFVDAVNG